MQTAIPLILCAHGTADATGQRVVEEILRQVSVRLEVPVHLAYVDVQEPRISHQLAEIAGPVIVVPLLLGTGFHVESDIGEAVSDHPFAMACPPLGPDPRLNQLMRERLIEIGVPATDAIIYAVAGSSSASAQADAHRAATEMADIWSGPVQLGFVAKISPHIGDLIASPATPPAGGIAAYLLAPGFFYSRLHEYGLPVTAPIGADPVVVEIVAERYLAALQELNQAGSEKGLKSKGDC